MNLWLSVWLFIHTLSWDAQITFTSIVFIAVEIEGLENTCLRRFPSVGNRLSGTIKHYYGGNVCLQCTHIQCTITGIEKYVDWLGNQIGGTEEPPPPQLTRRSGIKVLLLAFHIRELEKLKHR